MAAKEIEFVIGTDGKLKIDAVGFEGTECADATKAYEALLGGDASSAAKPEMARKAKAKAVERKERKA